MKVEPFSTPTRVIVGSPGYSIHAGDGWCYIDYDEGVPALSVTVARQQAVNVELREMIDALSQEISTLQCEMLSKADHSDLFSAPFDSAMPDDSVVASINEALASVTTVLTGEAVPEAIMPLTSRIWCGCTDDDCKANGCRIERADSERRAQLAEDILHLKRRRMIE